MLEAIVLMVYVGGMIACDLDVSEYIDEGNNRHQIMRVVGAIIWPLWWPATLMLSAVAGD